MKKQFLHYFGGRIINTLFLYQEKSSSDTLKKRKIKNAPRPGEREPGTTVHFDFLVHDVNVRPS